MNKYIKSKLNEIFLEKSSEFNLNTAIDNFLKEYNQERMHSATQEIPAVLFNCTSQAKIQQVRERLVLKNRYRKSCINVIAGTKIALSTHFTIDGRKLNFVKKLIPQHIIAIGELIEDFENGYAKINIIKWFEGTNSQNFLECDPKNCKIITQIDYERLIK